MAMTSAARAKPAVLTALAIGAALLLGAPSAAATAPGANGRIAFEFFNENFDSTLRDARPGGRSRPLTVVPRRCRRLGRTSWRDERPRYSPDGNWIVYRHEDNCRRSRDYHTEIRLLRADGGALRILLRSGSGILRYVRGGMYPVFSRDGKRFLFIALGTRRSRHANRLWIVDARSGAVLHRVRVPAGFIGNLIAYDTFDWSPADRVALFLAPRHRPQGLYSGRPGAALRTYRRLASLRPPPALDWYVTAIDWAPNGRSVLFERELSCFDSEDPDCPFGTGGYLRDIYQVFTKGRLRLRRATRGGSSGTPVFSPDGKSMAFEDERPGGGIFVRRLAGGASRRVTTNGLSPAWQPVTAATLFR
jgi:dipeptidyl aminopeptidase/acylaminoacyl peptidase